MRLLAIGDIHVEHAQNRAGLAALSGHREDWLILAGDISDTVLGLAWTLDLLQRKFAQLLWVPGNHDLWLEHRGPHQERGEERYRKLVETCRSRNVLTPEDDYVEWPHVVAGRRVCIALMHLLYDYSFAPDEHTGRERAIAWAAEEGIAAVDELRLVPDPFASREAWCQARVAQTVPRLEAAAREHGLVLVNHWPLRRDVVRLGPVPRYSPWCGTRATEDWHVRFGALASVHGHLHMRASDLRDGVRFEEVSLGYPAHWDATRGVEPYLRQIL